MDIFLLTLVQLWIVQNRNVFVCTLYDKTLLSTIYNLILIISLVFTTK